MSTRGVIARLKGDGWAGVYNHFDSYPTGLGEALWQSLHQEYGGDVEAFLKAVVDDTPQGWSTFCKSDYALRVHHKLERPERIPYGADEPDSRMTSEDVACLKIEWVYAFGPRTMVVFTNAKVRELREGQHGTYRAPWAYEKMDGRIERFPACYYVMKVVGVYPLDGPEPDWKAIEQGEEEQAA